MPKKVSSEKKIAPNKAGLDFPTGRTRRLIKNRIGKTRMSKTAPVYAAAVLDYITAEVLELAGNAAKGNKKTRITSRHIALALKLDEELNELFGGSFAAGGVVPHIHPQLLPKKSKKEADAKKASQQF